MFLIPKVVTVFALSKFHPQAVTVYRAWSAQPVVRAPESPYSISHMGFYRYQLLVSLHCNQVRLNPIFVLASFKLLYI